MTRRLRAACEHLYMLAVGFFLLWNVFYMTEAQWTFDVRGAFPALWLGLAAAALVMTRMKPGAGAWLLMLQVWMLVSSAYRGAEVLSAQTGQIARAALAFGVMLPAARVVRQDRLMRWVKALLALWTACMTLQAFIGLWAALTGHAVFSLRGTWYIGVNLGDHRLYLNAYVTTGAVKMGLSVLLAAFLLANTRKRALKIVYLLAMAVQLACLSLTDCRTAFIAVGASLGLMLAVAVLKSGKPRRRWLRWTACALAVLLMTAAVYGGLSGLLTALSPHVPHELDNLTLTELPAHLLPSASAEGAVQHRTLQAGNLLNNRPVIWRAALRLLAGNPKLLLTGTTTALAPLLTNAQIPPAEQVGYQFQHVHSIWLQTLVSWGLPGLLLVMAFLAAFLPAAWRVMARHALPLKQRLTPVPVLYVMLCEMVDCFTRFSEESPLLLFGCLFAGLTLAIDAQARERARLALPAERPVDVIIPVYNASAYVARATLTALCCPDARVILVDDGSTDGSAALCDRLAADVRVTVLHQENRGAAAARNAGLAAATAEFVAFLDADDMLLPGALAALTQAIGNADAAQGCILRELPEKYPDTSCDRLTGREALAAALTDPTRRLLCHGWLFRRTLLTERFNEALTVGEDGEWMLRTLGNAASVAYTNIPAYRYTVRTGSALRGGPGVAAAYQRTLTAASPMLEACQMPQEAALYRLTHLLLMLTHDVSADMAALRDAEPFNGDFARARLTGISPRMVTLRLLRARAYPLARLAIRLRRLRNRWSAEKSPENNRDL